MNGTLEADETYIGGKESNKHASKNLKSGRGIVGKLPVMGACERAGRVTTELVQDTNTPEIHKFITENVNPDSTIYSDYHSGYKGLDGYKHKA